jgi:hypothetical protein
VILENRHASCALVVNECILCGKSDMCELCYTLHNFIAAVTCFFFLQITAERIFCVQTDIC